MMWKNRIEIFISGIGGQGVVYSGNLIARAGLLQYNFASCIAHYGPESRGSITSSEVVISSQIQNSKLQIPNSNRHHIDYPIVELPDIFIAMHQKPYDYYITNKNLPLDNLKYLIYDSTIVTPRQPAPHITLCAGRQVVPVPATKLAKEKLNNIVVANLILTAVLVKETGILKEESLELSLKEFASARDYQTNLQALQIGYRL
ncbi:MAG: 2-oxoacid:acceptor oxidoreductase family protein [Planctomycetota bacterium]|nr:2-oxoacid:acceptor oxidoreductase family protein [Planctomycetota bacterium]MDI6788381.1 2-oxoacid:acceptor oxidoreductase family protein [Planctomycetota bacterium]